MVEPNTWRAARRSLRPHKAQGEGRMCPDGDHLSVPTEDLWDLRECDVRSCERPDVTGAHW